MAILHQPREREAPLRVRALGDCNTVASEKLCPADAVPSKLIDVFASRGIDCVLDNLGGTMNCSREGVNRMRRVTTPCDVLLVNYGLVDSWVTSVPMLYVPYFPDNALRRQLRKLLKTFKRGLRANWIRQWIPSGFVVPPVEFRRNISRIIENARDLNPATQIVLWSTVRVKDQPARNAHIEQYNAILRDIAVSNACTFLDVEESLASFQGNPYFDNFHLNGEGALHIAKAIAGRLSIAGLLQDKGKAAA